MENVKRILVACTMTKYCTKAIHYGFSLAKKYGADLSVLRVVYDPFMREPWHLPYMPMPALKKEYEHEIQRAKQELDEAVNKERQSGTTVKDITREGEPTKEILKVIKDEQIDLLVLLAYEEGHLEHFLFGRGTHELVRLMPCSILLVKKELEPAPYYA